MRSTITTLLLALTIATLHPSSSSAAVRHIDARCGAHRGRIVVPFLHRYHVRLGAKHAGGRNTCHGRVHRRNRRTANLAGSWLPFDLGSWSWRGVLDVGVTTITARAAVRCSRRR